MLATPLPEMLCGASPVDVEPCEQPSFYLYRRTSEGPARNAAGEDAERMMQREDYLLRMIAQMGRVLARIRRMLLQGKNSEAGDELQHTAQKGGIDLPLMIALDHASLEPLLRTGGEIDRPKCAFFAEVIYLEWRRQLAMGNLPQAERCAERALLLYALAYDGIVMENETRLRIAELEGDAEPGELPDDAA
jgi:hypothetical protein